MMKALARSILHIITRNRKFYYKRLGDIALRIMLSAFRTVTVEHNGIKKMPYGYFVIAEK